ncbi:MAG: hypothetical protein ACOCXZ_01210 [Chloroflexota bacterium]
MGDITIMDINATEDASLTMADVFGELQRQITQVQYALGLVAAQGRGEWIEQLEEDVELLLVQLDSAAGLTADVSDFLFEMVRVFRGDSAFVDDDPDDLEDYE